MLGQGGVDREGVLLNGELGETGVRSHTVPPSLAGERIVPHALALGLQVVRVLRAVQHRQHHAVGHRDAQLGQRLGLGRIGGEQADGGAVQIAQHLGGGGVVPGVVRQAQGPVGVHGVHALVLQGVGAQLRGQPDPAALMPAQVEQDARPGGGDRGQRGVQLIPAVAPV